MFGVTILGNNSALPAHNRHPTCQIVTIDKELLMLDCGEGTQMQLAAYNIRRSKIAHIFISHLHGDHYFGLMGLLNSFSLMHREAEINLYAPAPLQEIINLQMRAADSNFNFTLNFHSIEKEGFLVQTEKYSVYTFATEHRIACYGFLITQHKGKRKIRKDKLDEYKIPVGFCKNLKDGEDIQLEGGRRYRNEELTDDGPPAKRYAYCADTRYLEALIPLIKDVDLLYHETTYLKEFGEKAFERFHSTTTDAGKIAVLANAKKLLIGHYSSKYNAEDLQHYEKETREVFPDCSLSIEGVTYLV